MRTRMVRLALHAQPGRGAVSLVETADGLERAERDELADTRDDCDCAKRVITAPWLEVAVPQFGGYQHQSCGLQSWACAPGTVSKVGPVKAG